MAFTDYLFAGAAAVVAYSAYQSGAATQVAADASSSSDMSPWSRLPSKLQHQILVQGGSPDDYNLRMKLGHVSGPADYLTKLKLVAE